MGKLLQEPMNGMKGLSDGYVVYLTMITMSPVSFEAGRAVCYSDRDQVEKKDSGPQCEARRRTKHAHTSTSICMSQ